jgi:alkylated DNA nucleotide flippase Atl1
VAKKELVVALGEQIPPGQWESYGGLGAAMKVLTGTGNGRGAASAEDAARLDGLWGETYPWWRVRNADGRLVFGGRERGTKHVITDPHDHGNRRFVAEGGRVDTTGRALGPQFGLAARVRSGAVDV